MVKRIIKISFLNFWNNFVPKESIFYILLEKKYSVQIVNPDEADYVFFSLWGNDHLYVPDRCIKIFYTGEHICPDFNVCDYAMGFDWMTYGDRYFRLPHYAIYSIECPLMEAKHLDIDLSVIKEQHKRFCSFTVSNNKRCDPIRESFFYELSKYKLVDSGGRWNNNVGGPVKDKLKFDSQHKFSLAFENISHRGYTTEKIVQAFAARTIPIYWGDPYISKVFNTKSFINVMQYSSINDAIEEIKRIDNNDDLYEAMLKEPAIIRDEFRIANLHSELALFLYNIIEQPIGKAQRRNRITYYVTNKIHVLEGYYKSVRPNILTRGLNKIIKKYLEL